QRGARRPVEHFDKSPEQSERINVPDLRDPSKREYAQNQVRQHLQRYGCHEKFFSVERIRDGSGEKTEHNERKRLQKSRKAEFKGRSGNIVDLVERSDITDLPGQGAQDAGDPEQPIITNQKR